MSHCPTLIHQLRQRGYRITPQREMVIEALANASDHVTAEEIFDLVKDRSRAVNIATIYRTLDTLVAEGLVRRTNLLSGQAIYVTRGHGAHIHLICRNCGSLISVDQELAQPLMEQLQEQHNFIADMQHLSIVGVCIPCQAAIVLTQKPQEET